MPIVCQMVKKYNGMQTDANMEEKVLKSPLPVLLYAWAPW